MKNKIIYLLIALFIFIGALMFGVFKEKDMTEKVDEQILFYSFLEAEGHKLGLQYNMHRNGIGGGGVYGLNLMSLSFERFAPKLTENEARKLIINIVEEFLTDINHNEALRPFLKDYPFSENNIDLTIFNYEENGSDVYDPYISVVGNAQGKIRLLTEDKINKKGYKSRKFETYEEAVAIIRKESKTKQASKLKQTNDSCL